MGESSDEKIRSGEKVEATKWKRRGAKPVSRAHHEFKIDFES